MRRAGTEKRAVHGLNMYGAFLCARLHPDYFINCGPVRGAADTVLPASLVLRRKA